MSCLDSVDRLRDIGSGFPEAAGARLVGTDSDVAWINSDRRQDHGGDPLAGHCHRVRRTLP